MKLSWAQVRLGEVLTRSTETVSIVPEAEYRGITVKLWGKGVVARGITSGADIASKRRFVARGNQFILSRIDARNGATGIVPAELDGAVVTNDFPLFDLRRERLDPLFLGWLTKTRDFVGLCQSASEGTTNRVRLQEDRFLALEIPLPPLAEQQRIVAQIEELIAKIAEARALRHHAGRKAEMLVASHILGLFKDGQARGWSKGTVGNYVVDACYGTSEKTSDDDCGVPILRMGNIQRGRLDFSDLKYLHLSGKDRVKLVLSRGDILVNRTNSAELVGKCAVFEADGVYAFASYLIRIRLDQTRADPRLVAAYINSPLGREYMLSEKRQMTGQANVNLKKLTALPIALPSLPVQRRIVAELSVLQTKMDALQHMQAETAAELDAMLPTILYHAFRGNL